MIRAAAIILWKDLVLEFRGRELLLPAAVFGLLIAMLYGFAFDPTAHPVHQIFPGLLWIGIFFASFLAIGRAFGVEADASAQILLAPVDHGALFLAKLWLNILLTGILALVLTPAFSLLLSVPLPGMGGLFMLVLVLGIVGFAASGTAMAALSAQTRLRELLLPALLLPFITPLVLGAVSATQALYSGHPGGAQIWIEMLVVFDFIFILVPLLLFEYLMEV